MKPFYKLRNAIQYYDWGSRTAIAALQGRPVPAEQPEAELWMGAHPKAPSRVTTEAGEELSLDTLIHRHPVEILGPEVARRFSAQLPFLFKVLAADRALSIQAHPSADQAHEGFRRENRLGIPLDAPHRNYRDPHHKPEILSPLEEFWALSGFRPLPEIASLVRQVGSPALREIERIAAAAADDSVKQQRRDPPSSAPPAGTQGVTQQPALRELFGLFVALKASACDEAIEAAVAAAPSLSDPDTGRWITRLQEQFPGDRGVLAPLLLNVVRLTPGQALFMQAGSLHAYLSGVGVELMANSDNVLRGGLTHKHVDVPELLRTLTFHEGRPPVLQPKPTPAGEALFPTPAGEFLLSRILLPAGSRYQAAARRNVEILLAVQGRFSLVPGVSGSGETETTGALELGPGESCLVPAATGAYRIRALATASHAAQPGHAGGQEPRGRRPAPSTFLLYKATVPSGR